MSSNDEQLQIIVRAVDEATQTLKAVQSLVSTMGGSAEETATKVSKMSGAMSVLGQIGTGILRQIGVDVWNEITNAVRDFLRCERAILQMALTGSYTSL